MAGNPEVESPVLPVDAAEGVLLLPGQGQGFLAEVADGGEVFVSLVGDKLDGVGALI